MNMRCYAAVGALFSLWAGAASAAALWPESKVTVRVHDDAGAAVRDAAVRLGIVTNSDKEDRREGATDPGGAFEVVVNTSPRIFVQAAKPEHYPSEGFYDYPTGQLNGLSAMPPKWEPYNAVVDVLLRRIVHPIPMYAKRVNVAVPAFGRPLGFDLSVGDWVAPTGRGKVSDLIFTARLDKRAELDFDYALSVTFPNPGDGIQAFEDAPQGGVQSRLKSPYQAPREGYRPEWVQSRVRRPNAAEEGNLDPRRNYFLRVRTVLDSGGKPVSAHYGKIYGDFMDFAYYLNPDPNDRNVEFDPARNLISGLKGTEAVRQP